jgi:hypothetical protein
VGSSRQFPIGQLLVRPQHLPRHDNHSLNAPNQPPTSFLFTCISNSPKHHKLHSRISYHTHSILPFKPLIRFVFSLLSDLSLDTMKTTFALAASSLLGSASAGVHRMKLEKIPFDQQLVRPSLYVHFEAISLLLSLARLLIRSGDRKAQTLLTSPAHLPINMAPRESSASHPRTSFATLPSTPTRMVMLSLSRTS